VPNCELHHQTEAVAACRVCDAGVCGVCRTRVNSADHCPGCSVGREDQSPVVAAVFSLFVPGLGQVYNGQWPKGLVLFVLAPLVVPWVFGVVDAARRAEALREGRVVARTVPTGCLLLALKVLVLPLAVLWVTLCVLLVAAVARWAAG
jgi:hypothetical protein